MTTIILNVCVCLPLTRSVKEFAHSIVSANDAHPRNLLSCPTFENIRFIIAHYRAQGSSGTFWKGAFFCWSKTQVLVFFFRCCRTVECQKIYWSVIGRIPKGRKPNGRKSKGRNRLNQLSTQMIVTPSSPMEITTPTRNLKLIIRLSFTKGRTLIVFLLLSPSHRRRYRRSTMGPW